MITTTPAPLPGSVFSPTSMRGIEERFVTASMRSDVPPCEYVEADFGNGLVATVEDLGIGDDGRIRRECLVHAGGVSSDFRALEQDGSVPDGSLFGS